MSTLAILQARMSSTRFPGKVLAPLAGQPMVLRQIERISRASSLDGLIVATSTDSTDDELVDVLASAGIAVLRGDLDDVLGRFVMAIDELDPRVVVRLTADCPLTSPAVIDKVVGSFNMGDADYVSNTMRPTYPDGLDVEVVSADVLRAVASEATDPHEREHVTLGVYRRHERFRIRNVAHDVDLSSLRWTVDTPADYAFVASVYEGLYPRKNAFDMPEVLEFLTEHPELGRTTSDAPRNAALEGLDTGAMNA